MKMMMKGKKERRMKARMTSTEDWWIPTLFYFLFYFFIFFLFFKFLQSLGASCSHFPPVPNPSCAQSPCFWGLASQYHGSQLIFGEMSWAKYNGKRKNLQYSVLHSFLSFLVLNCGFSTTTTVLCGKKEKPSSPFGSAGGWRVLGPCVVVHRILAFFLSLYIGLRDYTVSMWIQTVSIYQHVSVYFLLFNKNKKKEKKGG